MTEKLNKETFIACFIAILLSLDSALKIAVIGLYFQAGIIILLVLGFICFLVQVTRGSLNIKDKPVVFFALYFLLHSFLARSFSVYSAMALYVFIPIFFYFFYVQFSGKVNWRNVSKVALWVLIISGTIQYLVVNYLGAQIELRGLTAEYYRYKGDLGNRMRGFYLEPNWFGISVLGWLCLYLANLSKKSWTEVVLVFSVFVCLFLSDNRIVLVLAVFSVIIYLFSEKLKKYQICKFIPIILVLFFIVIFGYLVSKGLNIEDRSALARTYTAINVFNFMSNQDIFTKIFGFGFSDWGYYSNRLELSWSNYEFDQSLLRRDNAELYVFLFEMGALSVLIAIFDLVYLSKSNRNILCTTYFSYVYILAIFYPILTYLMYMLPFLVLRYFALNDK